jgi:DNA-binding NtrC family response regulator
MRGTILVVDDEPLKRITLQIDLSERGFRVFEAADALAARRIFDSQPIDVVVSDVRMPGMNGLELLAYVKQARPDVDVILMTAFATIDTAVLAIKRGAYDYITKPFTTQDLLAKLERLLAARSELRPGGDVAEFGGMVARTPAMKRIFAQLRGLPEPPPTVLISGEIGTGKTRLAEEIHAAGLRADRPLVRVACATTSPHDIDAELFGVQRGGTGGPPARIGSAELAAGGTLLIDDAELLPAEIQPRLLRLLERNEFVRVGGDQPLGFEARIICTTRADLPRAAREGRLREDLYYRLAALTIALPALRERPDDISLIARQIIERRAQLLGARVPAISAHALDELARYAWPGNIRELEHVLERALLRCGDDEIRAQHVLPLGGDTTGESAPAPALTAAEIGTLGLNETVADIERRMILMALRQCSGNQARAAGKLGIPRTTLRDKMAKYSIATE